MKTITIERAERIARNINAMDIYYEYSDDSNHWRFFNNLKNVLIKKLRTLTTQDIEVIKPMLDVEEAKFFNLI